MLGGVVAEWSLVLLSTDARGERAVPRPPHFPARLRDRIVPDVGLYASEVQGIGSDGETVEGPAEHGKQETGNRKQETGNRPFEPLPGHAENARTRVADLHVVKPHFVLALLLDERTKR